MEMQGSGQGHARWRRRNAGIWAGAWNMKEEESRECRDPGRGMEHGGEGLQGSGQGHRRRRRRSPWILAEAWNMEEEECRDPGKSMEHGEGGMQGSGQEHGRHLGVLHRVFHACAEPLCVPWSYRVRLCTNMHKVARKQLSAKHITMLSVHISLHSSSSNPCHPSTTTHL